LRSALASSDDGSGLAGKVAVVAGAGAHGDGIGNGRATAILLARWGVKVVAVDLDLGLAERTREMIVAAGGEAIAVQADVSTEEGCSGMVDRAVAVFGRLDLLDNNVGITPRGTVVETSLADWRRTVAVNLDSVYLACKFAIPAMLDTARSGAIVNVASIAAFRPSGGRACYAATKAGILGLTRELAVDHGRQGIRTNCVVPGPVFTPLVEAQGAGRPEARARRKAATLVTIEGNGWDIGHAARFLLSDQARFINGETLLVDGGALLVGPDLRPES
jgi:NAD(P)-dependent dehydrogenase (short-subunit alcohol dehydrogenase family)